MLNWVGKMVKGNIGVSIPSTCEGQGVSVGKLDA